MELKKTWKSRSSLLTGMKGSLGVALIVAIMVGVGSYQAKGQMATKEVEMIEDALRQGIVQCYALEGVYPPDLDYLVDYYGVVVDLDRYIVHYDIFASNIYPDLAVIPRKWGDVGE